MNTKKIKALRENLRILEREAFGVFNVEEGCCGVTPSQCHTLIEIGNRDNVSLVDLAAALNLDTSTLSRTIQGLVMIGLALRTTNETDRRYVTISLTEQGRKVYEQIETVYNAFIAQVFERLPAGKHDEILTSLEQFVAAVKKTNDASGCCRKGKRS
jgi:DNA-binding MarR family transcriptional regulator